MISIFHGKKYYMELKGSEEYNICLHALAKTTYLQNLNYEFISMMDEDGKPIKVLVFNEAPESFNKTPKYNEWELLKRQIYKFRKEKKQ